MPLKLYNTLTRTIEPFMPRDPARVTFYTCGPTVYDYAHIGNFRSFLAADVLRRFVESPLCEVTGRDGKAVSGPRRVVHVMNITDVGHMTDDADGGENGEDRMAVAGRRIAEAKKSGRLPAGVNIDPSDPYQIAAFYGDAFVDDAKRLGLKVAVEAEKEPGLMPRATKHIDGMKRVIDALIARGHAYVGGAPGRKAVYFSVESFERYGALSGNTLEALQSGAGGRISEGNQQEKKHPADFLLWKEDAAHVMKWPSPGGIEGQGYPGWHIECTVMSARSLLGEAEFDRLLGEGGHTPDPAIIDIHSGGEDNIFPHHECEIAQSSAAFCADAGHGTFARMWFHPRFLFVEGAKMSKSKGNFFTARDLFAKGYEPAAVRLELIKTHYRSNANFTEQGLRDSQRMVERLRRFAENGASDGSESRHAGTVEGAFAEAMHEDLNIAGALGELNKWLNETPRPTAADLAALKRIDAVLGLLELEKPAQAQTELGLFMDGLAPDPSVIAKLQERVDAKKARDFKRSDAIRDELAAMGYAIKDVAGGKVEVRRK
ncbi:MAG: cysteine--tRNA ligase [Phycisphaerales bacterium]|nr:cysteine--tRNA ligase [Phycisphaerales bacterium]